MTVLSSTRFSSCSKSQANSPIFIAPTRRPLPLIVWNARRIFFTAFSSSGCSNQSCCKRAILTDSSSASSRYISRISGSLPDFKISRSSSTGTIFIGFSATVITSTSVVIDSRPVSIPGSGSSSRTECISSSCSLKSLTICSSTGSVCAVVVSTSTSSATASTEISAATIGSTGDCCSTSLPVDFGGEGGARMASPISTTGSISTASLSPRSETVSASTFVSASSPAWVKDSDSCATSSTSISGSTSGSFSTGDSASATCSISITGPSSATASTSSTSSSTISNSWLSSIPGLAWTSESSACN